MLFTLFTFLLLRGSLLKVFYISIQTCSFFFFFFRLVLNKSFPMFAFCSHPGKPFHFSSGIETYVFLIPCCLSQFTFLFYWRVALSKVCNRQVDSSSSILNSIETCIISCMKRVASPGLMHGTGCLGLVHCDEPEGG